MMPILGFDMRCYYHEPAAGHKKIPG